MPTNKPIDVFRPKGVEPAKAAPVTLKPSPWKPVSQPTPQPPAPKK